MMSCVDILLSTFNGERHLEEQLNSIEAQSVKNWTLLARDDGSTDSTRDILKEFAGRNPSRVRLFGFREGNMGTVAGFSSLMLSSGAAYIMFCDQDDVWLPDKIEKILACMKTMEAETGEGVPLLVHCDLMVTNENLTEKFGSFRELRKIEPGNGGRFNRQLVSNVVTGCAMMINRALLEKAAPIPPEAMAHDWWVAQVASAFGSVSYMKEQMVLYRQHRENIVGVRQYSAGDFVKRIFKSVFLGEARKREAAEVFRQVGQGKAFYSRYGKELTVTQKRKMENYLRLYRVFPVFRFVVMARYGLWRSGFLRNIAMGLAGRVSG